MRTDFKEFTYVKKLLTLAPALVVFASLGAAQTQKIASIDMQQALIGTKDGQKAVNDLRAKFGPKDQELQKRGQELQAKQDQYRKTMNTISEEAKATLEREIDSMTRGLQRDSDDAKQDMDQDQQRVLQELGAKIMQVVTKYATDNQYAVVFDVSGQPNNILFASSTTDITRDVIALYDKSAPTTPTAPPAVSKAAPAPSAARPVSAGAPAASAPRKPATAAPAAPK
jgi:outer membrane protein